MRSLNRWLDWTYQGSHWSKMSTPFSAHLHSTPWPPPHPTPGLCMNVVYLAQEDTSFLFVWMPSALSWTHHNILWKALLPTKNEPKKNNSYNKLKLWKYSFQEFALNGDNGKRWENRYVYDDVHELRTSSNKHCMSMRASTFRLVC